MANNDTEAVCIEKANFEHNHHQNQEKVNDGDVKIEFLETEARCAIEEMRFAVSEISLSEFLPMTETTFHLNLTTKEDEKYCVEFSSCGYQVVGRAYDTVDDRTVMACHETLHSLLESISPMYRTAFAQDLAQKLMNIQKSDFDDEDDPS